MSGQSAFALGLVPSTTKGKPTPVEAFLRDYQGPPSGVSPLEIDRCKMRASRMRKSLLTAARLHVEERRDRPGSFRCRWAMLTATYRDDGAWSPNHVKELLRHVRLWCKRRAIPAKFLWCLELTKALRPHYHVLIWLPMQYSLPKPDKQGWWPWGMTRIETARKPVGYVAKYASKAVPESMAAMPKGARTHGVGGLESESKRELRWWKAPLFAREGLGAVADIRKVIGGYACKCSGEFLRSPWHVFVGDRGRVFAWRDDDVAGSC